MRRICAWCRRDLDGIGTVERGDPITHGICESCASSLTANGFTPLRIFLDALETPVLLVDSSGAVLTANEIARRRLGIESAGPRLRGDILRCVNASLPGGCGKSGNCGACHIQRAVTRTFKTGLATDHLPVFLDVEGGGRRERVMLRISTERVNGSVLLRLDAMEKIGPAPA